MTRRVYLPVLALILLAAATPSSNTDPVGVMWLAAPLVPADPDCTWAGAFCGTKNTECENETNDDCRGSLPNPFGGCQDPSMVGRTDKSDVNKDCCWCVWGVPPV